MGDPVWWDKVDVQPALFCLQYCLGRLWASWGVEPAAVVGHSLGEYAAACLSGVFSLEDALQLVTSRARLLDELCVEGRCGRSLPGSRRCVRRCRFGRARSTWRR